RRHVSRQAEADRQRLPRGDARRLRDLRAGASGAGAAAPLHDDEPEAAQAARRGAGDRGDRTRGVSPRRRAGGARRIIRLALRLAAVLRWGCWSLEFIGRTTETVPSNLIEVILAQGKRVGPADSRGDLSALPSKEDDGIRSKI